MVVPCKYEQQQKQQISTRLLTLTGDAVFLIFPHEIASSGRAPESEPSNSWAVLT